MIESWLKGLRSEGACSCSLENFLELAKASNFPRSYWIEQRDGGKTCRIWVRLHGPSPVVSFKNCDCREFADDFVKIELKGFRLLQPLSEMAINELLQ